MMILGINFAIEPFSLALVCNQHCKQTLHSGSYGFTEDILTHIDALLHQQKISLSEISAIGIIVGPGAYTSLRISITTIKTLAKTHTMPVYPIDTLEMTIFPNRSLSQVFLSILPAKPGEINCALFSCYNKKIQRLSENMTWSETQLERFLTTMKDPITLTGIKPQFIDTSLDSLVLKSFLPSRFSSIDVVEYVQDCLANSQTAPDINALIPVYSHDPFVGPKKKKTKK